MLSRSQKLYSNNKSVDFCIIGSGIIGSTLALELTRTFPNTKILVLDRNKFSGAGTTSYSSGVIRCFYSVPETVALSYEAYHYWLNFQDFYLRFPKKYRDDSSSSAVASMTQKNGWILKSNATKQFVDNFLKAARDDCGMKIEELDRKSTFEIANKIGFDLTKNYSPKSIDDPEFGIPVKKSDDDCFSGSLLVPETGYVSDPRLACENICEAARLESNGNVEFRFNSQVVDIDTTASSSANNNKRKISGVSVCNNNSNTETEFISAGVVINAAGCYSSSITEMVFPSSSSSSSSFCCDNDMTLTTRALRAECAVVDAPPNVNFDKDGVITFDVETGFYLRPETGNSNRMLIGGLDLEEVDKLDFLKVKELPDFEHHPSFSDQVLSHLYRFALRVPTFNQIPSSLSQVRGVVSSYDVTEDWSPIVDGSAVDGYYMSIGTSGNCFKLAPLLAKILARKIENCNEEEGVDSILLNVSGMNKNFSLDTYSRKRRNFDISSGGGVIG